ncbi:MAG: type VII secretion integral membrane protein EccD [Mycobacteriaceae bacterium]|nr:type VII secretion integral membrane protein EccD [Mycobacteriaceae bacterium]
MTAELASPAAPSSSAPTAEVARARVAVLVGTYQVDAVIPTKFPVEMFIDDLLVVLRDAIGDPELDFTPSGGQWSLARAGQQPLPRWRTPAEHGIDDGTVLLLTPVTSGEVFTPVVEDMTDALALINEREFAEFDADTAAVTGLAAWNLGTLATAALLLRWWTESASLLWCAVPALLLGMCCWAAALQVRRRAGGPRLCLGLALSAIVPLFAGGAMLVPPVHSEQAGLAAPNLVAGAVVATAAAATMIRLTRLGIATLTAVTVAGLLTAAAAMAMMYLDLRAAQVNSALVALGLLLLGLAPRMAVFIARIRPPDLPDPGDQVAESTLTDIFDAESGAGPDPDLDQRKKHEERGIESRARLAVTTLRGLIAALCAVTAIAQVLTCAETPGGIREIVMASCTAGVLVLRSRWFPDRVQALAFAAGASVIVVGVGAVQVDAYQSGPARLAVLAVVMLSALAGCVAALRLPGVRLSPVTRRVIDVIEHAMLAVVPVIAFWIMGVYTRMRKL